MGCLLQHSQKNLQMCCFAWQCFCFPVVTFPGKLHGVHRGSDLLGKAVAVQYIVYQIINRCIPLHQSSLNGVFLWGFF